MQREKPKNVGVCRGKWQFWCSSCLKQSNSVNFNRNLESDFKYADFNTVSLKKKGICKKEGWTHTKKIKEESIRSLEWWKKKDFS